MSDRGYILTWPDTERGECEVNIAGRRLEIILAEIVKQVPHQPTREEAERQRKYSWNTPKKWDYKPTGHLRLTVGRYLWVSIRHTWTDGKRGRLEGYLGDVLRTLRLMEHVFKKEAEEDARRAQEEQERRRREEEVRRQQAEHARKIQVLRQLTNAYHESRLIHEFLDNLGKASETSAIDDEARRELRALTEWGKKYADGQDPRNRLQEVVKEFGGGQSQLSVERAGGSS
jgi:hypothetical protein